MLEKLRSCVHQMLYPYNRRQLRKPTMHKAVHFELYDRVRDFFRIDPSMTTKSEPLPVGGSPNESGHKSRNPKTSLQIFQSPSIRWEVICSSKVFKATFNTIPVRLERLWVSADEGSFVGSVVVSHVAGQRSVTCMFTFDCWETFSEANAQHAYHLSGFDIQDEYDRFLFTLKLPGGDLTDSGVKTFHCCVRYVINGQEFWDDNNSLNYQVSFRRREVLNTGN